MTRAQSRPARLSVVICCFADDRYELVLRSIDSVVRQTVPAHELLVVVDHNPALAERLRDARPLATVIESIEPTGVSGARNTGLKTATGDVVAFLDDDAEADPDWLEQLEPHYADSTVIGVGGTAVPRWASAKPAWFPAEFYWVVGCSWRGLPEVPAEVRNFIGANMSFRRSAALEVGGFANEFFFHDRAIKNDDTEFCIRITGQRPDRRLLHAPDAVVHHFVPTARTTRGFFVKRCWREGRAKRITTSLVGQSVGLASERAHLRRVIPSAMLGQLRGALRGELSALGRLVALTVGTLVTVTAFVLPARRQRRPDLSVATASV